MPTSSLTRRTRRALRVVAAAFAASLLVPVVAPRAQGAAPAAAPAPQVMILGAHHMGGSGDYVQAKHDDVLSERRQREIEALVDRLAEFRPTKIAVEVPVARDSALNALYRGYVAGTHALRRNEIDQIAFRLARKLGHAKVHAVDFKKDEDIGGLIAYAAATEQDAALRGAQGRIMAMMKEQEQRQGSMTVTDILREANSPQADALESFYLLATPIGDAERYVGADLVAGRFERNLKIFANIARLAEPGDRVLVVYGASHGKLLRQFVDESPALDLVRADAYLAPRAAQGPGGR